MWPFSRRTQNDTIDPAVVEAISALRSKGDKGAILNRCPNDVARRSLCLQWAGEARDAYYEGRRVAIEDMLLSKDRRYRHMSVEVRMKIGEMKWSKSLTCKEIVDLEQMYGRWASMYSGGPGAS